MIVWVGEGVPVGEQKWPEIIIDGYILKNNCE